MGQQKLSLFYASPVNDIFNSDAFLNSCNNNKIRFFHLKNNTLEAYVTNLGATMVALYVPDRNGKVENICLGYKTAMEYLDGGSYFGAAVGPLANRIAKGQFSIHDKTYQLPALDGENSLHCGTFGISHKVWDVVSVCGDAVEFSFHLKAIENVYPANVMFLLKYAITNDNVLEMQCQITSDGKAPVNFTQHNYYNLKGEGCGNITDHLVFVNADHIVEVRDDFIPTGELMPVQNTPFDLHKPTLISDVIIHNHRQIQIAGGFDHTFAFSKNRDVQKSVAMVESTVTGRKMEMFTNQPGVQFYTGNFLDGNDIGPSGKNYFRHGGFCLEAQNYPDAVNQMGFPDTFVEVDKPLVFHTRYKFSTI